MQEALMTRRLWMAESVPAAIDAQIPLLHFLKEVSSGRDFCIFPENNNLRLCRTRPRREGFCEAGNYGRAIQ